MSKKKNPYESFSLSLVKYTEYNYFNSIWPQIQCVLNYLYKKLVDAESQLHLLTNENMFGVDIL